MSALSLPLALQYALIALAVIASVWVVANKQFPGLVRRLRIALAMPLVREGRPSWLRALGRRVAPAVLSNDGCNSCGGCEPPKRT